MTRPFRALRWKEMAEVSRHALPAFLFVSTVFVLSATPSPLRGDPDPARHFTWMRSLTALIAFVIGFWQTYRESSGDLWGFALHRPVARIQVVGAKVVAGVVALLVVVALPYFLTMWWLAIPGHRAVPFDRALLWPGIADLTAGVSFYAAGLYAGIRKSPLTARAAAFVMVMVSSVFTSSVARFGIAVAVDLGVAAVLVAGSAANFTTAGDHDAQTWWGKASNILTVAPAIIVAGGLALAIAAMVLPTSAAPKPAMDHPPLEVFLTNDGRLAVIHRGDLDTNTGIRPIAFVSDLAANRIPGGDSAIAQRVANKTYESTSLPTNGMWYDYIDQVRYRDTRAWIKRIMAEGEGPAWYYDRRESLISIFDRNTLRQTGWLGPDGYAPVTAKPAARFPGFLKIDMYEDSPRSGMMVVDGGVYHLDGLAKPRVIFMAAPGERVLAATTTVGRADPVSETRRWGSFFLVTTTRGVYVLGPDGAVQIMRPGDSTTDRRTVSVVRAPESSGSTTFLWYHPRYDARKDTLNLAIQYQQSSSQPVAEYRFVGIPYDQDSEVRARSFATSMGPLSEEVSMVDEISFVPSYQIFSIRAAVTPEQRAKAIRKLLTALGICLVLAVFTLWLCRRYAFSTARTVAWVVLTLLLGPVALLTMWVLLTWPARERCPSCGKARVTNREHCEHCGAPFGAPQSDGTEVFAM